MLCVLSIVVVVISFPLPPFCFIERFLLQECLSLPVWLSEESELGSCTVAILKAGSAAAVMEGNVLGSACVAHA